MSSNASFWRDTKCLVTGGVGFIGSHLCKHLYDLGAKVTVLDKEAPRRGTLFNILAKGCGIHTIRCDLINSQAIDVVQTIQPDYIFHLAALPYAPYTTLHPQQAYASNVLTTVNALEGARLSKVRKFVLASSACVFGAAQHSPLKIDDAPYKPEHYYSVTKQDAERQVRAFHQWYRINANLCRFGNVYGPGDRHFGRIIPQLCYQLIKERREVLQLKRSKGDSLFEFLFVNDAVAALIKAAEHQSDKLDTFHFSGGPKSRTTILQLAQRMSEMFDGKKREILADSINPEQRVEKYLDTTATERFLEWQTSGDFEKGLKKTLHWYKRNLGSLMPYNDNE
jgi:UDP-glucose 4-epimerase